MHKVVLSSLLILLLVGARAQTPQTASEYISFLGNRETELSQRYLSYMSESAHGNRARKLEKKRKELIAEISKSLGDASRLRPFNGDATLRDAYKHYWDILLKVFNEDYHKIVNMEEIAEQSYDNMEAYLLAQEKAGEVLHTAQSAVEPVFKTFAQKNNIRIVDTETRMSQKLRQVGEVNAYYHKLYLIFFKSFKQEVYVTESFNKKDINAVEQNRNTLVKFASEGLSKLDTMNAFKGDGSMITACRKVLEFHKSEAQNDIPVQSEFLIKSNEFEKIRKAFDAKPPAKRTQADVDNYNKAINEMNQVLTTSNKSITAINKNRETVMNNWESAANRFMETHVPRSK
ncbi:MAG: hypothetical protein C0490_10270 [Marivirga sp.]|nr:hypothetical protein [Marivirga sp.]